MQTLLLIASLLAAQTSLSHYWHKLTDRTFSGIYHANAFDLTMMIPYFIVLFILAVYGLHRYWLVYDYYKYSQERSRPAARSQRSGRASPSSFPFSTSAT